MKLPTKILIISDITSVEQYYHICNLIKNTTPDLIISHKDDYSVIAEDVPCFSLKNKHIQYNKVCVYDVDEWNKIYPQDDVFSIVVAGIKLDDNTLNNITLNINPSIVVCKYRDSDFNFMKGTDDTIYICPGQDEDSFDPYYMYVLVTEDDQGFSATFSHSHEWLIDHKNRRKSF